MYAVACTQHLVACGHHTQFYSTEYTSHVMHPSTKAGKAAQRYQIQYLILYSSSCHCHHHTVRLSQNSALSWLANNHTTIHCKLGCGKYCHTSTPVQQNLRRCQMSGNLACMATVDSQTDEHNVGAVLVVGFTCQVYTTHPSVLHTVGIGILIITFQPCSAQRGGESCVLQCMLERIRCSSAAL